jgi:hypothetical protein
MMKFDGERWTDSWYYADGLGMLLQLGATHLVDVMQKTATR